MSIAEIVESVLDGPIPVGLRAYDGSSLGPPEPARALHLRTPRAASYLATAPSSLGLARAYVSGDLAAEGVHPAIPTTCSSTSRRCASGDPLRPPLSRRCARSASRGSPRRRRPRRRPCRGGGASPRACATR